MKTIKAGIIKLGQCTPVEWIKVSVQNSDMVTEYD